MKRIIVLLFLCASGIAFAQNQPRIDSLNSELQKHEARKKVLGASAPAMIDTAKALLLNDLNREFRDFDDEKGLEYAKQCLELSEHIGYKKGVAHGYNDYGLYYFNQGNNDDAERYYNQSLKLRLEINDAEGISSSYNNLGMLYRSKGDDAKGLYNLLLSLRYSEATGAKRMMAATYHNIGLVYAGMANFDAALENFTKAKKINTEIGNKVFLRYNLLAIAGVYSQTSETIRSIAAFQEGLKLRGELHLSGVATENFEIGDRYFGMHNYSEAMRHYLMVLEEAQKFRDTSWLSVSNLNIGRVYNKQNELPKALYHLKIALTFAERVKRDDCRRETLNVLAEVYGKRGNYSAAWKSHTEYEALKDTTDNIAHDKENVGKLTQMLLQSSFDKQRDSTQAVQDRKDAVQATMRNSILVVLAGTVVFLFVVYRQRNRIKSANTKNEELLLNILPAEVAEELKAKGAAEAKLFDNVTVLFTDFKSFTTISEQLSPQELVNELHACFKSFDEIIT